MNPTLVFIVLLPLVLSSSIIHTSPPPGSYDLNTWLAVHIDEPGCYGISFDPNGLEWMTDYVIQHGECWDSNDDGINDHGTIIVEFMRPYIITDPKFKVYPSGHIVTARGMWMFGY